MGSLDDYMDMAHRTAAILYGRGAKRVWLFGAQASNHEPDMWSDLDLAVEGIPQHKLKPIADHLRQMLRRKVDLVDMDTASPRLRPHVLRTKVLLPRRD